MEATDLEARMQDARHDEPRTMDREEAFELFSRLEDAGLEVKLRQTDLGITEVGGHRPGARYVIEVKTDSISSPQHLRLLADMASRNKLRVGGDGIGDVRLG